MELSRPMAAILEIPQYVVYQKNVAYALFTLSTKSHTVNKYRSVMPLSCAQLPPTCQISAKLFLNSKVDQIFKKLPQVSHSHNTRIMHNWRLIDQLKIIRQRHIQFWTECILE